MQGNLSGNRLETVINREPTGSMNNTRKPVWKPSGSWKLSGNMNKNIEAVWKPSVSMNNTSTPACFLYWNLLGNTTNKTQGTCRETVWKLSENCLDAVWKPEAVWKHEQQPETLVETVWKPSGTKPFGRREKKTRTPVWNRPWNPVCKPCQDPNPVPSTPGSRPAALDSRL